MKNYPPIQFVFFEFEQESDDAWGAFEKFVTNWNKTEHNKFESEMQEEWFITFEKGLKDPEIPAFRKELQILNKETGLVWFVGIKDERTPEEFEKSPFIDILGDGYPEGFIVNESTAFGSPEKCQKCGNGGDTFRKILQPIIIDETHIGKLISNVVKPSIWNPDMITLPNGGLLISKKVLKVFNAQKVIGYELSEVISKHTMAPSDKWFLIKTENAILHPSSEHTLTTESGICSSCGRILGGLLTHYTIRKQWLKGAEIFSRHPYHYANICLTNRLYWILKDNNIQEMSPSYGIFQCENIQAS